MHQSIDDPPEHTRKPPEIFSRQDSAPTDFSGVPRRPEALTQDGLTSSARLRAGVSNDLGERIDPMPTSGTVGKRASSQARTADRYGSTSVRNQRLGSVLSGFIAIPQTAEHITSR